MEFNKNQVITGQQLDNLSDTELEKRILNFKVFARVNPHQKLKIVTFLQKQGEIIAMTGDGVNDSLALKKADIGVVMGDSSDVAKGTADLILLDNNFSTIVEACEQGRLIYENIPKVISYILSNSFVEIVVILGSIFLNLPLPLTIAQILWLHLICDGPPDIVLSFEPPTSSLLRKNPREIRRKPILGSITKWIILAVTLSAGLISLINYSIFQGKFDLTYAQTVTFASIGTIDLIYIFSFKNLDKPVLKLKTILNNKYLFFASIYGFILLFSAVYVPYFNRILGTTPLDFLDWVIAFSVAGVTTISVELVKYINHIWEERNK